MGLSSESGIKIGRGTCGARNLITDVSGVTVGNVTLRDGDINTGVTAILPHGGDVFHDKVMASACVINGFGKSIGLMQIEELGTIETPIILTNTLSVGTAATACVKYMLDNNPDIGTKTGTVNPVVCECNDAALNDIRGLHIKEKHIFEAIAACSEDFSEGAVGAGTGMSCLGLKGGIGSASRVLDLDGKEYTIGAFVLSNFGGSDRLVINGDPIGLRIKEKLDEMEDRGSIIMLIATDIPLSERQLRRVARRSGVGLARTGSYYGNGSGDIAIAFTTANRIPHYSDGALLGMKMLADQKLDRVFDLTAEAVEEAIISSLYHADTTVGRSGKIKYSLRQFI